MTFFCGGPRNVPRFIHLFDKVFVLDINAETLNQRLASRPKREWGSRASEHEFVARPHASKEDIPKDGITIDTSTPLADVVDRILNKCN
jgi:thymidylate kinase